LKTGLLSSNGSCFSDTVDHGPQSTNGGGKKQESGCQGWGGLVMLAPSAENFARRRLSRLTNKRCKVFVIAHAAKRGKELGGGRPVGAGQKGSACTGCTRGRGAFRGYMCPRGTIQKKKAECPGGRRRESGTPSRRPEGRTTVFRTQTTALWRGHPGGSHKDVIGLHAPSRYR